jgi:Flp pilus assembly protein TadG
MNRLVIAKQIFGHRSRAQAMVEFALIATALFLLMIGIIEVGAMVVESTSLSNGAYEGARAGAITGTSDTTVTDKARAAIISYGAVPTVIITNYTVNNLTPVANQTAVVKAVGTRAPGDLIQVQVSHVYQPIERVLPFGGVTLNGRALMIVE